MDNEVKEKLRVNKEWQLYDGMVLWTELEKIRGGTVSGGGSIPNYGIRCRC